MNERREKMKGNYEWGPGEWELLRNGYLIEMGTYTPNVVSKEDMACMLGAIDEAINNDHVESVMLEDVREMLVKLWWQTQHPVHHTKDDPWEAE